VILVAQAATERQPEPVRRQPEPAPQPAPTIPANAPETTSGLLAPSLVAYARKTPVELEPEIEAAPEPVAIAEPRVPIRTVSSSSERRATTTHRVQPGEYLTSIGRQYGVSAAQIKEWNGLSSDTVHPGQTLRITSDGAPAARRPRTAEQTTHTVQAGDNLTQIARRYGVSVRDIQQWNRLSSETIRSGQRLVIRRPATTRG
jgi:LysM repeat protein